MKVLAWVFIGVLGAGATYISLTTEDNQVAIISGLIGTLSWMLFAYFALGIRIYDSNGSPHVERYPAMAAFGLAMAAPNFYIALTGPLRIVSDRDQIREEVLR